MHIATRVSVRRGVVCRVFKPIHVVLSEPLAGSSWLQATIRAKGKVTVTASQAGDANYLPAKPVKRTIMVR